MVGDVRLGITAKDAQMEVKNLTEKFKELNAEMDEAAKNKDWASFNSLASAMNNLEGYKKGLMNEARGVPSNHPLQNPVSNVLNGGTNMINTVGNGLSAAGSGSVGGMINSGSQMAQTAAKGLGALGLGAGATAAILGAAGLVFAGGAAAQKTSEIWENQMDSSIDSNAFYNSNRYNMSAKENSRFIRERFNTLSSIRQGTKFSTEEAVELSNDLAKYGFDENSSLNTTSAILNAQSNTPASRDALSKLAGLSNLYGQNGAMSIQNAYQGLKNSGMTEGRFDEFINSVTQAMEEGVSKGFKGSVEDIVNNQTLFAKLSGNDVLWTGKNGADRLNKISNGFANAVNLNSTTDMMMYGAAKGTALGLSDSQLQSISEKSGINAETLRNDPTLLARVIMEQGAGGSGFTTMLGNYAQNVRAMAGGNSEMELQAYMKSFGLNTTGAAQLMELMHNWEKSGYASSFDVSEATNIINKNKNEMVETNYKSEINDIKDSVANLGMDVLSLKEHFVHDPNSDVKENEAQSVTNALEEKGISEEEAKAIEEDMAKRGGNESVTNAAFRTNDPLTVSMQVLDNAGSSLTTKEENMNDALLYIKRKTSSGLKNSSFIDALTKEGLGSDERDDLFKQKAIQYAIKDDGRFTESELTRLLREVENNAEFKSAYYKGSESDFETSLENVLKKVFDGIVINEKS